MPDPKIEEVVKHTLAEIKKQSFIERLKGSVTTLVATAAGTLITLLFISKWNQMEDDSKNARMEVKEMREENDDRFKLSEAQIKVIIDKLAKIETNEVPKAIPYADPVDNLKSFEESKEKIQGLIDKEIYRTEQRK